MSTLPSLALANVWMIVAAEPPCRAIESLFERLWNAVGPVIDQIKDTLEVAYKTVSKQVDLPPLDEITKMIDTWYDRCEAVNFFVAIFLMLSASSDIDEKGMVVPGEL